MKLKPKYWRQKFKDMRVSKGYGQRKRKKEEARYPLLAMMDALETPEEMERKQNESGRQYGQKLRREQAVSWLMLRRWIRSTSEQNRAEFFRRWRYPPHEPHYGLDIASRIDKVLLREVATLYGQNWIYEASDTSRSIRPEPRKRAVQTSLF